MIDIKAFKHSTTNYDQYLAYQKYIEDIFIHIEKRKTINAQFDIKEISFIDSIMMMMFVRTIEFHVIRANIFFLLCLINMNNLSLYLNNLINKLIMKKNYVSIIWRFDHLWLLWENSLQSYIMNSFNKNSLFWIDVELRQLHQRFDYSFVVKLHRLLEQSRHEMNKILLDKFIEICSFC